MEPSHFAANARQRRHAVFLRLLDDLPHPISVLDVGGTVDYWRTVGFHPDVDVLLLNIFPQNNLPAGFKAIVGDARDLSSFPDKHFDVVFSNSVIGHVGGFAEQQRMAREIGRVGRRYFVQTPNHGFPLDWRTLIPGFHWLPASAQAWCFRSMSVGTYPRAPDAVTAKEWATRVRNLRRRELPVCFPGATVQNERVAGLTKSFIVIGR